MFKIKGRSFVLAVFTLIGSIIGAGILGLPYVFAQAGFWIGFFWLIFIGLILLYVGLCLGEVTLRTKKLHQLPGYAEKYLGKKGKFFVMFSFGFSVYSALLAYLIGEGQSLSYLFTGGFEYSIYFGIGFWVVMSLLLHEGVRGLRRVETFGVIFVIIIIGLLFLYFLPNINVNNFSSFEIDKFFLPFGVVLFALLGFTAIPKMRELLVHNEKQMKLAIIFGNIIPVLLYLIFVITCVGVFGKNISEVATLSIGRFATLLGIFTMTTCYFIFSFALKDVFRFDLKKKKLAWFFVSVVPIVSYLLVSFFGWVSFVLILGIGGSISGSLMGISIMLMSKKAKEKGDREPEYSMLINWFIILFLSFIFIVGILLEIWSFVF